MNEFVEFLWDACDHAYYVCVCVCVFALILTHSYIQSASFTRVFPAGAGYAITPCNGVSSFQDELGRWPFDEGYGNITKGTTYLDNNAFLVRGPAWVTGKIGLGLSFAPNGTAVPFLQFLRPAVLAMSTFSVSLWAWPTAVAQRVAAQYVIYPGQLATADQMFALAMSTTAITVYSVAAGTATPILTYRGSFLVWTAVAVVVNSPNVTLYVNGAYAADVSVPGLSLSFMLATFAQGYRGRLDEVRVYHEALDAASVNKTYTQDNAGMTIFPFSFFYNFF